MSTTSIFTTLASSVSTTDLSRSWVMGREYWMPSMAAAIELASMIPIQMGSITLPLRS